jgi:hypothetical protein
MTLSSQPLPNVNAPNATEDPKIRSLLSELQGIVNGGLDSSNITDGTIANADLANSTAGVWKNLLRVEAQTAAADFAANQVFGFWGMGGQVLYPSGQAPFSVFQPNAASIAVPGMTTKFRVVGQIQAGVSSAVTWAFALTQVTSLTAGGSSNFGSAWAGSSVSIVNPSGGNVTQAFGAAFAPPADGGGYVLTVMPTTAVLRTATTSMNFTAMLQFSHV